MSEVDRLQAGSLAGGTAGEHGGELTHLQAENTALQKSLQGRLGLVLAPDLHVRSNIRSGLASVPDLYRSGLASTPVPPVRSSLNPRPTGQV